MSGQLVLQPRVAPPGMAPTRTLWEVWTTVLDLDRFRPGTLEDTAFGWGDPDPV